MGGSSPGIRSATQHPVPSELRHPLDGSAWRSRVRHSLASAALLTLAVATADFWFVWHWEETLGQSQLSATARNHFLAVQDGLDGYLGKLTALRGLFESSSEVTRAQFATFTGRLLENESPVQNFSWVPRVVGGERAKFEQAAARNGIPGY